MTKSRLSNAEYNISLLNAVRDIASESFRNEIPFVTAENYNTVAQTMALHVETLNEFTGLVTKIGLQLFSTKMAMNPLERFKRGTHNGTDIEEIFVAMASSVDFDSTGGGVTEGVLPNIETLYYKENYRRTFKVTTSDQQARNAFVGGLNSSGLQTLMGQIVQSMYSGAYNEEFTNMKKLLQDYSPTSAGVVTVTLPTNTDTAKSFIKKVRTAGMDMSFMSDAFNKAGVTTRSENMTLIVRKDVLAETDVEVLAKAYNMGKTDFEHSVIVVDNFGTDSTCIAMLVDNDFFMMFDNLQNVETFRNGMGMFTNHFLHIWQTQAVSHFKNAIKFKTAAVVKQEEEPKKPVKETKHV